VDNAPIQISIELRGIAADQKFLTAVEALTAAADELIAAEDGDGEVSGYVLELPYLRAEGGGVPLEGWKSPAVGVQRFSYVYTPEFKK
jgi:hypothetical protein